MVVWTALGCKQKMSSGGLSLPAAGSVTQVLKDFQMQDILEGRKNMVVEAPEGRILDTQRIAEVDKPHVTFYKKSAVSSVLDAPQGRIQMDTHEVLAWGGVTVVTPDSATLTTEHLRYDPKTQHLLTEDPVRIEKPDSITLGKGLDAEPDLSHVRIGHQKVYIKSAK
jgi:LPS export ABC transporter protein LptC